MTRIPDPLLKIGYNLLFTAGFALTWPYFTYLIWRRQPFWERLGERLGHYPKEVKEWLKPLDALLLIVGVPALILIGAWRLGLLARLRGARRDRRG